MTTLDDIRRPVSDELALFDELVDRHFSADGSPVAEMLRYALSSRGKGIRPLLVLLSAAVNSASGRAGARARLAAMLVEMIHVASLVHDDVIDESAMRRGRPSVNARWQSRNAVVVGDYILARTMSAGLSSAQYDLVQHITGAIAVLCEGEVLQSAHTSRRDTDREAYLEIIRRKTATLLSVSASAGAIAAGASAERVETMRMYGESLGMAFQIQDDILDYSSSDAVTGKPSCNDLREGKITLPLIAVLEQSDASRRAEFMELLSRCCDDESAVSSLCEAVSAGGGLESASRTMYSYLHRAEALLACYDGSPALDSLRALCRYVGERDR